MRLEMTIPWTSLDPLYIILILSIIYLSICLSVCLSVYLSTYLSIYLSIVILHYLESVYFIK